MDRIQALARAIDTQDEVINALSELVQEHNRRLNAIAEVLQGHEEINRLRTTITDAQSSRMDSMHNVINVLCEQMGLPTLELVPQ